MAFQVGIRWYPYTLSGGDTIILKDGVARISLVHYNTVEEVKKITDILREILLSCEDITANDSIPDNKPSLLVEEISK